MCGASKRLSKPTLLIAFCRPKLVCLQGLPYLRQLCLCISQHQHLHVTQGVEDNMDILGAFPDTALGFLTLLLPKVGPEAMICCPALSHQFSVQRCIASDQSMQAAIHEGSVGVAYLAISAIGLTPGSHHKGVIDSGARYNLGSCLCELVIVIDVARQMSFGAAGRKCTCSKDRLCSAHA